MNQGLALVETGGVSAPVGPEASEAFASIVGDSPALRRCLADARRIAERGARTVLVIGETGTGKELFARGIHAGGPASDGPFVPVNCPALPASLLEAELFGYERGAFTGARERKKGLLEVAGEGTLFLDEVSSLPLDLQPKLLRALEDRKIRRVGGLEEIAIRCRVVAATNESLETAVATGRFRADLYYRLNVLPVTIPPLREREGDVTTLARHFAREAAERNGVAVRLLSPEALGVLEAHGWPGNVRELKNVVDRAVVMGSGPSIGSDDLHLGRRRARAEDRGVAEHPGIEIPPDGRTLASIEAEAVARMLEITGWNKSAAARILEISRPTLTRKIRQYGIRPPNA
ncbi:sigma-54 interaction domain-containing protein [Gaopeijia maritima]|uniref:Sigma 54-interacting transcriptional regulator n=1 Tax=Gaopeijia maritima TaxID=3119007 RepID=A0ABU9E735_9BACT